MIKRSIKLTRMICVCIVRSSVLLATGQVPASKSILENKYMLVDMTLLDNGRSYLDIAVLTALWAGFVAAFRILISGAMHDVDD